MTDIHHDAAAILTAQLRAKDEEITAMKARLATIDLNLTAAVDTWLEDQRYVLDQNRPNPETPEREVWDKLDRIHWPLLDCVATAANEAKG